MPSIAVIGAGVTGVTTAYSLVERGYDVTVFDRHDFAAMETSYANGGQLSASNAETWNQWANVLKGLKWMLRADAPLLINPTPSFSKIAWMASFLANIPNYRANTEETVRLALKARARLDDIAARESIDFDCERRGILHFYETEKALAHAERVSEIYASAGLRRRRVSPQEMAAIEPTLQGDFVGGLYTDSDRTGDAHRFTTGLAKATEARGGAFRFGDDVAAVRAGSDGVRVTLARPDGARCTERFDGVVVCAGVGSRRIARALGDYVPVYPVKGYSITVMLKDEESRCGAPWVSLLDDDAKIVTSRLGEDRFRIAGTAEFNGENRDIRADRIAPLVNWCRKRFPSVSTEYATPWAGLRPMTPNMMPRVGRGRNPRVFYNTGHGHLGWTLSAATAEIVSEAIHGAQTETAPRPIGGALPQPA